MMEERPEEKENIESFPSVRFLVRMYSFGAIFALLMSMNQQFDDVQIIVALLISWFLAAGALGIHSAANTPKKSEEEQ